MFAAVILLGVPWLISTYPQSTNFIDNIFSYVNDNYAAVFKRNAITVGQLQGKYGSAAYSANKVRIILVPGHEPDFGGTEYADLKERDLNVEVAEYLKEFLVANTHYEVVVSRDKDNWNSNLKNYFDKNWNEIIAFLKQSKTDMVDLVNNGHVAKYVDGVQHNNVPMNVALRLYGINKWINENKIDIAIHIHFNDYARFNLSSPGKYSGISIYVPEKQYSNSSTTKTIADAVLKRLSKYNPISNLPIEKGGVIEDQDLIAIGSYNTLDVPAMLIEYGYIYESRFTDKRIRDMVLKDLAYQTYLGLQDFFGNPKSPSVAYDTLMLPYSWKDSIDSKNNFGNGVLALQSALVNEGLYPGIGKTKNECPITGTFGPCTMKALSEFQKKYGILDEKGIVGEKTKEKLNSEYSLKLK